MSFAMGRLGFLTPFKITSFAASLDNVLTGRYFFRLRSRVECEVVHQPSAECPTVRARADPTGPATRDTDAHLNPKVPCRQR